MAEFNASRNGPVPNLITVTIRSTKRRKDISIEDNHRIYELKKIASSEFEIPLEQTCLISNGSSLPSNHSLQQCSIQDGSIIHLIRMHDGLGPASKRMKMTTPAIPFGLSEVGGLEGLVQMGLASENYPELQAKVQTKFLSDPPLLHKLLQNSTTTSDALSDTSAPFESLISKYPGLLASHQSDALVADAAVNKMMTDLLKDPSVKQEMTSVDFKKSIGINKEEKKEDKEDESDEGKENEGEKEGEKEEDGEGERDEEKDDEGDKKGLDFMHPDTRNLIDQLISTPDTYTNLLHSNHYQEGIKALALNPPLLKKMLLHSPGLEGIPDDDLQHAVPYFARQLQNEDLYSYLTNARALQATLDITQATNLIHHKHPNIFKHLSDCTSHHNYLQHLFTNSFSQKTEEKYQVQLQQLSLMGFPNAEDNVKILDLTMGDVNSVLQYYTQQQYTQQQQQQQLEDQNLSYEQQQQLLLAQQEAATAAADPTAVAVN